MEVTGSCHHTWLLASPENLKERGLRGAKPLAGRQGWGPAHPGLAAGRRVCGSALGEDRIPGDPAFLNLSWGDPAGRSTALVLAWGQQDGQMSQNSHLYPWTALPLQESLQTQG